MAVSTAMQQKVALNLWFDTRAEEAAGFSISAFKNGLLAPRSSDVRRSFVAAVPTA